MTRPLKEKADSEATVEAWTLSRSRAIAARTGNWGSFSFHQGKMSKLSNSYSEVTNAKKSDAIYLPNSLLGVLPRARLALSLRKVLNKQIFKFLLRLVELPLEEAAFS
ncbi:hypothetical protein HanRHA438_Chr06g0275861 [Helianthus annuus]|uniref:Uncharacterized protein n=1 Tax=Helianthus annuus TaxID=4232 RepID=A0A251UJS3_HELAN|nr:hypothetical protein HanXRQr2_Chr06g0266751 [Helianthus annuus]KAJ0567620.1 hypothetical protein HanIR_Chr06g0286921 [Helianthus annuus]KAJ0741337.1 hypothetical protein HanOQP8_Chr06g0226931 [Helianthus annuus]KAJ0912575.1 hypothetical protein HanRHA438_Chr06g0275861 [Helianthus annuus]KAJ0916072.1 hypothetical protein HanPSC8_Chr06g0257361 [Helianthus annuus]